MVPWTRRSRIRLRRGRRRAVGGRFAAGALPDLPAAHRVDQGVDVARRPREQDCPVGADLGPALPGGPRLPAPLALGDVGVAEPVALEPNVDPLVGPVAAGL